MAVVSGFVRWSRSVTVFPYSLSVSCRSKRGLGDSTAGVAFVPSPLVADVPSPLDAPDVPKLPVISAVQPATVSVNSGNSQKPLRMDR